MVGAELADVVSSPDILEFPLAPRPTYVSMPDENRIGIEATTIDGMRKDFVFARNCIVGDPHSAAGRETALQYLIVFKEFYGIDVLYGPSAGKDGLARGLYVEAAAYKDIDGILSEGLPDAAFMYRRDAAGYERTRARFIAHLPELNPAQPF